MGTYHADGADRLADEWIKQGHADRLAFADQWRRDPKNATLCRIYGAPFSGWTNGQLAALWRLIAANRAGHFVVTFIKVGATPERDSAYDVNQELLSDLPLGITAEVYQFPSGGSGSCDGRVVIPDGICVTDEVDPDVHREADGWNYMPLEIGTTDASRTLLHLIESGAVARWPYDFDRMYTLTTTPRYSMTPGIGAPSLTGLSESA